MQTPSTPTPAGGEASRRNPGDESAPEAAQTGEAVCPECNGTGKVAGQRDCPNCGGSGKIVQIVGDA